MNIDALSITSMAELEPVEVFDTYEYRPSLFLTNHADFDEELLVFWLDDTGTSLIWIASPVPQPWLSWVRSGKVSVREFFLSPIAKLFEIERQCNADFTIECRSPRSFSELKELLPDKDCFIVDGTFQVAPERLKSAPLLVKVDAPNDKHKAISADKGYDILTCFKALYRNVMEALALKPELTLGAARTGSFMQTYSASHVDWFLAFIENLFIAVRENKMLPFLRQYQIDYSVIEDLLVSLSMEKLDLLISKDDEQFIALSCEDSSSQLDKGKLTGYHKKISSNVVPQANSIEKLLEFLEYFHEHPAGSKSRMKADEPFKARLELTSNRQIDYYIDALVMLGYVNKRTQLTPAGLQLIGLPNEQRQLLHLSFRFESSEVGATWLAWSSVHSLEQLEPESAEDFLLKCTYNLSNSTAKRRAKTLSKWLKVLKKERLQALS